MFTSSMHKPMYTKIFIFCIALAMHVITHAYYASKIQGISTGNLIPRDSLPEVAHVNRTSTLASLEALKPPITGGTIFANDRVYTGPDRGSSGYAKFYR